MKSLFRIAICTLAFLVLVIVCYAQHYTQTNLVSNTADTVRATDNQLVNAWGLARSSGSAWWIADEGAGLSTLYNGVGTKQSLVVVIPAADPTKSPLGSPTGTVFNGSTTDFLLAPGAPATFIFSTMDGTIAGWNAMVGLAQGAPPPSTHATTVVKTADGSAYTGLTIAQIEGETYLFAANFAKGRIDVFDSSFKPVKLPQLPFENGDLEGRGHSFATPFTDETLPDFFVPFNVQAIGDNLVVTYVQHLLGFPFETDGPGLGFVDIYTPSGQLVRRLEHGDWLNAPWGVALAPLDFGRFSHDLLVGQFAGGGNTQSSGFIAAYDMVTGRFDGLLEDATGKPIAIIGIWSISPGNASPGNADPSAAPAAQLYFTAGPNQGTGGLFGYLTAVPSELTEGNGQ